MRISVSWHPIFLARESHAKGGAQLLVKTTAARTLAGLSLRLRVFLYLPLRSLGSLGDWPV